MDTMFYFKFIGARAQQERVNRNIDPDSPLAVDCRKTILDCDEKAFKDGIRPGDTIRQAKLASPCCKIVSVSNETSHTLTSIIDALSSITPFVEPDEKDCGVFLDVGDKSVHEVLSLLNGMFYMTVVTKSTSKFVAKASSVHMAQQILTKRKIKSAQKPWGCVEMGANYALVYVKPGKEAIYLANMPISLLWPLPSDVISILYSLGFRTFKDLQQISPSQLSSKIGDWAPLVVDWAKGKDVSQVKPLNFVRYIEKTFEIEDVNLDDVLKEISEELVQKNLGFRHLAITFSGDFPPVKVEKEMVRPVFGLESLRDVVSSLIEEMSSRPGSEALHRPLNVSLFIGDLEKMPVKQMFLINTPSDIRHFAQNGHTSSASLQSVFMSIEEKYGESALFWGIEHGEKQYSAFKQEFLRREKMLSFWDPMRFSQGPGSKTG